MNKKWKKSVGPEEEEEGQPAEEPAVCVSLIYNRNVSPPPAAAAPEISLELFLTKKLIF